jgi:hypothetical protein
MMLPLRVRSHLSVEAAGAQEPFLGLLFPTEEFRV